GDAPLLARWGCLFRGCGGGHVDGLSLLPKAPPTIFEGGRYSGAVAGVGACTGAAGLFCGWLLLRASDSGRARRCLSAGIDGAASAAARRPGDDARRVGAGASDPTL